MVPSRFRVLDALSEAEEALSHATAALREVDDELRPSGGFLTGLADNAEGVRAAVDGLRKALRNVAWQVRAAVPPTDEQAA